MTGDSSTPRQTAPGDSFPIVGIGASAGGIEALKTLFSALPANTGACFVVVLHLAPDRPSSIPEILARTTAMEVVEAVDGVSARPNTIFVIPPAKDLVFEGARIRLVERRRRGGASAVDRCLASLAREVEERAVAVILSGAGTDGAQGVKAVRDHGGIVVVQAPASANYRGMPEQAVFTCAADWVLPLGELAARLGELFGKDRLRPKSAGPRSSPDERIEAIFRHVKARTGHDFGSYKSGTVLRRIDRRMAVTGVQSLEDYAGLLARSEEEARALSRDLLIGVTSFFRDPDAFEALRREVLPRLFADGDRNDPVRVWHACASTGEEAYSAAILIQEYLQAQNLAVPVHLFATDLDEDAIATARAGRYPESAVGAVGEERLRTFFTRTEHGYQVVKPLRDMIVFAQHDVVKDPLFSRLDLLVCRNVLIYLNADVQKRLLGLFHQSLRPGGFLFLGSSETVGHGSELFAPADKLWRIFERREGDRSAHSLFPLSLSVPRTPAASSPARANPPGEPPPGLLAEKLLLERYAPPCVVVSDRYEVVHVSTRASRFLEVPVGEPTRDILRMAKEPLRPALRAAIHKAVATRAPVVFRGVRLGEGEGNVTVDVQVEPLDAPAQGRPLAMVLFEIGGPPASPPAPAACWNGEVSEGDSSKDALICQLEEQLRITYDQLQATIDQLETSNEGLMSSNEELVSVNEEFQSTNEELQSTNEELETSREELQTVNEELVTVNAELQEKVDELRRLNADMENLFASSAVAALFLDRALRIQRFSPAAAELFHLLPADVGRPFEHMAKGIDWPTLARDAQDVLQGHPAAERELAPMEGGRQYLKRVLPYRTGDGGIEGVVVTFVDLTERRRAEEAVERAAEQRRLALESAELGAWDYHFETGDVFWDERCRDMWGIPKGDRIDYGDAIDRIHPEDRAATDEAVQAAIEGRAGGVYHREFRVVWPDGSIHWIASHGRVHFAGEDGRAVRFVGVNREVTEEKRAQEERERLTAELDAMLQVLPFLVSLHDKDGRYLRVNPKVVELFGVDPTLATREEIAQRLNARFPDGRPLTPQTMPSSRALAGEAVHDVEYEITDGRGGRRTLLMNAIPLKVGGEVTGAVLAQLDITERRSGEEALREGEATLRGILDAVQESIWLFDADGVILLGNHTALARMGRSSDEVVGRSFGDVLPEDLAAGRAARLREVVESGQSLQFEDDRGAISFHHSFYPVADAEGRVTRVVSFSRDITERRRSEEALRARTRELETARAEAETERRLLEAVMAALPVGVAITDSQGGTINANEAFERLWGGPRPPTRSVGDYAAYRAWWADSGRPVAPQEWASARALGNRETVVGQLLEIERFDGSRAYVLNSASPVFGADGAVVGSAVAIQDVTELRSAEEALRKSEGRFRALFEHHGAVMLLIDPESGAIVDANEAAALFYGRSRDELRRMTIEQINLLPPEEVARERRNAAQERRSYFVFPHQLSDGTARWVEVYATPVEVRGTTVLFSVIHDITERRRAEEALHESEQRLRFHVENSPMAVVEWNAGFVVTRWAGGAEKMFGWTEQETVGRPLSDLGMVFEDDLAIVEQTMARLTDGVTRHVVSANRNYTKTGRVIDCEWYNSVLLGPDGAMASVLSLVLDVTERQRYERELTEAREAAEAANRAKSEFLAMMSHEIRTPMNGVIGMTELALMETMSPKVREYLTISKSSAKHLLDIINDVLDLAKIEAGRVELLEQRFGLREVVKSVLSTLDVLATGKGLRLEGEVAAHVPRFVQGDQGRLSQVLVNLLGNAIKFTEKGAVTLSIVPDEEGGAVPPGRVRLLFSVADSGIGIPADKLTDIFQSFSQATASHHAQYGGTGLGLAIARQIVALMGGRIWAESELGVGSTFRFTVELGVAEGADSADRSGAAEGPAQEPVARPLRVLLAEDNPVNQLFAETLLQGQGHEVIVVENGREALEALSTSKFDLIFMDVQMPEMDGLEAARAVRAGEAGEAARTLPMIALTAHALSGDRERFLAAGMDEYITKPIDIEEVRRVLAGLVRRGAPGAD